jgi:gliding motility-associated-like protein
VAPVATPVSETAEVLVVEPPAPVTIPVQPVTPKAAPAAPAKPAAPAASPAKPLPPAPSAPTVAPTPAAPSAPQTVATTPDPVLVNHEPVETAPAVAIEIPNVITPNGDGYNDQLVIQGIEHCDQTKLIVRNRTGIVFQTTHYRNDWDANGLPDGTYFYQFYYSIHGIGHTLSGTLTIMR